MFNILKTREFALLFAIGGLQSIARWLELLAFGVYVYDLTGSPLLVTMVTLVKFAPLALFGLPFGTLTSVVTARSLYLIGVGVMIAVSVFGLYLTISGSLSVAQVLLISFVGGLFWVLDFPVRRALIGDAVHTGQVGSAMAVDTIANNGTRMLGPLAGGALLQFVGLCGVFVLSIAVYSVCFLLASRLRVGRDLNQMTEPLLTRIVRGLQHVVEKPVLLAFLLITVIYNLFGFPILSLIPVLGKDSLLLSAGHVGLLASMEGVGAMIGSLLILRFGVVAHYRKYYTGGVVIYFAASATYAMFNTAIPVAVMLVIAGTGSAAFAAMQTTLLILNSTTAYRSRLFGLLSLSIGAGAVGLVVVGLLANVLGVAMAIVVSALAGIISIAAICRQWPSVIAKQE